LSQIADLQISGLSHDGQGVGRLQDGRVVFVAGLLPGERARVQLVHSGRNHLVGHCLERLESSLQRRRPPCILAEDCGGCSLQHLTYAAQLQAKQEQLGDALNRIGHLSIQPEPILAADQELAYRTRAVIPLDRSPDGTLRAGFYRRGSHRIVNLNHCPVLDPRLDALIEPLKHSLEATGWPVDRHLTGEGGLRHLALRVGSDSGAVLITLIASHERLEGLEQVAATWMERWPQVVGVMLNIQPRASNVLFGPYSRCLAGQEWVLESFAGLRFALGCDSFFQVNPAQAEKVVPLLRDALPTDGARLIDAYCGVGAYGLPLAAAGHRLVGLELHAAAVHLARSNAQRNGLSEVARFVQGPVADHLSGLLPEADAVLVDPPRKGLDAAVLQALIGEPVQRLLYLSCNPATLARDLQALCGSETYQLERLQPIDFFPNTSHVECLAVLSS
jgi:23S rRNA (uracil1939-C5)-methyltransferase